MNAATIVGSIFYYGFLSMGYLYSAVTEYGELLYHLKLDIRELLHGFLPHHVGHFLGVEVQLIHQGKKLLVDAKLSMLIIEC